MAGLDVAVARTRGNNNPLYKISVTDGKTADDILVNIYKNGKLNTIINFHAESELQYNMALNLINRTTLYRTESINALVNSLKELKQIQFYNI